MKDSAHNFPLKLHTLLDWEDPDVVCWTPSGAGFRVINIDRFRDEVIPKYWRHTKMCSFQRQLNLYGFKKVVHGTDIGAYHHPLFLRGQTALLQDMKRSAIKSLAVEAEQQYVQMLLGSNRAPVAHSLPSSSSLDMEIDPLSVNAPFSVANLSARLSFYQDSYNRATAMSGMAFKQSATGLKRPLFLTDVGRPNKIQATSSAASSFNASDFDFFQLSDVDFAPSSSVVLPTVLDEEDEYFCDADIP